MWFYKDGEERIGPFSPEEMESFVASGVVTKTTSVRGYATSDWSDAENSPIGGKLWPINPSRFIEFLPVSDFAKLLAVLLSFLILISIALIAGIIADCMILSAVKDETIMKAAIYSRYNTGELQHNVIFLIYIVVWITTAIFFLMWTYRCNVNVRTMGATGLRIRPGWAVGWYFIPVFNLWKPYQAMKEVWQASLDPTNWFILERGRIMAWWWGVWIISGLIDEEVLELAAKAETLNEVFAFSFIMITVNLIDILSAIMALLFIRALTRLQQRQIDRIHKGLPTIPQTA